MIDLNHLDKLPRDFYLQDVVDVARSLLGKIFVRAKNNYSLAGKIVEVEAYDGLIDQAAHSYKGMTDRNKIMFREGGYLYIYFIYGMHFCGNVVTGDKDHGCAVLLRGIEPLMGVERMSINRFGDRSDITPSYIKKISNGPAKICQAFELNGKDNGTDLTGSQIYILENRIPESEIVEARRIGIKKSKDLPWRFYLKDNKFVSSA